MRLLMQLSPEVEFWLKVASILVPTLTALIVPFVIYHWITRKLVDHQARLSKEIEDHKISISKELEIYKFELQSTFQKRFYEFQTKYSLLHQKRAAHIEKLFELLAILQNDLQHLAYWDSLPRQESKEDFYKRTNEHFNKLIEFYDEKRIFFDEETGDGVRKIVGTTQHLLGSNSSIERSIMFPTYLSDQMIENARNLMDENIHLVMKHLEKKFIHILSAEVPDALTKFIDNN